MRRRRPQVRALIALCLAALAAGCGGGGAAAPTAAPPALATLILDFSYVEVIEDCDGIEGDGDFHFGVATASTEFPIDVVYSEDISLGPGGKSRVLGRRSYTIDAINGKLIHVEFNAAEFDETIFGDVYDDERLDHTSARVDHVFRNGTWSNLGPQSITLGGSGCRVRLYWSAEAS
jgi:hypothetical protein